MSRPSTQEVWELLSAKLRGFIRSRVSSEATADDLLQETFVRIHEKLDTLQYNERLSAWVFRVARNLINDQHKRKDSHHSTLPDEVSADQNTSQNLNGEVQQWIVSAVRKLPEPYREAVQLYELDEMSQQQIADALGLSLSGAKSRIQRGREKLQQVIRSCCHFELDRRGNVIDYVRIRDDQKCEGCCSQDGGDCPS